MNNSSKRRAALILSTVLAASAPAALLAQQAEQLPVQAAADSSITVRGQVPSDIKGMEEGPDITGFISARNGDRVQITAADGSTTVVSLSDATEVRGKGGFLGLGRKSLAADALLNGLPVSVKTVQWTDGLIASRIQFKQTDLATAGMVRNGTAQRFGEHQVAIEENAAATEALRGRMGDIDKYNLKGTTNVYFDTGKWQLTPESQAQLCQAAQQAGAMDNALLLVVGYTDEVGDEDYNQELSERRAAKVVNYLQQRCRWAPYRMLTPTGMAESDPAADNTTPAGRAQNRRVSVNILVSKAVDGA